MRAIRRPYDGSGDVQWGNQSRRPVSTAANRLGAIQPSARTADFLRQEMVRGYRLHLPEIQRPPTSQVAVRAPVPRRDPGQQVLRQQRSHPSPKGRVAQRWTMSSSSSRRPDQRLRPRRLRARLRSNRPLRPPCRLRRIPSRRRRFRRLQARSRLNLCLRLPSPRMEHLRRFSRHRPRPRHRLPRDQ
jgi:hypothetical protein